MTTDLRTALADRLDEVVPPPGDLAAARHEGRALRTKRRVATGAGAVAVLAAAAVAGSTLVPGSGPDDAIDPATRFPSLGALDFSHGLRTYGDPGFRIHMGGRSFPIDKLTYLDTDAAATPHGMVFFDAGRPMLLDGTGSVTSLVDGPLDDVEGFHPTAKFDATGSLVAWATLLDGTATLTVRDMDTGNDVATEEIACGRCGDLVIDGIDGGVVFVRDGDGTRTWDSATGEWSDFAGPETRVADVRNGVVLHDGPAPTDPGDWWLVAGPIDSELSHDGRYVRGWSSRLEPVRPGDDPIVLEQGPTQTGALGFWTFDTDGSVLVADPGRTYPDYIVYDCELPSGACTELGPLRPKGGDPMFVGNDM